MFGGWSFATDLAWELVSPQTLPRLRGGADERKKERKRAGGRKEREKREEGQKRGNWYPSFFTYESCAAQPLWAVSVSNFEQNILIIICCQLPQ